MNAIKFEAGNRAAFVADDYEVVGEVIDTEKNSLLLRGQWPDGATGDRWVSSEHCKLVLGRTRPRLEPAA